MTEVLPTTYYIMKKKVNIGILGSTGSIGTQALQVISECKSID